MLTGQLGDVMKESVGIALTYVKSHAAQLEIDEPSFDGREIHIHVPAGAIPKEQARARNHHCDGARFPAQRKNVKRCGNDGAGYPQVTFCPSVD